MREMRWLVANLVLLIAGSATVLWALSLAAFLVPTCGNHFGFSDATSPRCLQPILWGIAGSALLCLGVVSGAVGLVRRGRQKRAGAALTRSGDSDSSG
jgi:hypothetical protein